MLEGSQIVHSDKISHVNSDASHRTFRMRMDAHCCALGKVMLAYRPENEISSIYKSYNFFPHTRNTIHNLNDLKKVAQNSEPRLFFKSREALRTPMALEWLFSIRKKDPLQESPYQEVEIL